MRPSMRWMTVVLAAWMPAGCIDDDEPGVRIAPIEARMVFCGGTSRGSLLRFAVTNRHDRVTEPIRLETRRAEMAGEGEVAGSTTFEPDVVLAAGETPVVCGRALPSAFRLLSDPPTIPVLLRLVYRLPGEETERSASIWVEVEMDYRAEACADLPRDLCRPAS